MLGPPAWLKRSWLEPNDLAGLDLFKKYRTNAPRGIVPVGGSTVQGVYCMTADGEYLAGTTLETTHEGINAGIWYANSPE